MHRCVGFLSAIALSTTALALPIPGGGPSETDCHAEFATTRMKLNFPPFNPSAPAEREEVRCFDGDPGCDLDGRPNGVCVFDVDVCLRNEDPALPSCTPEDVVAASASADGSPLPGLTEALEALLPATATVCTEGQTRSLDVGSAVEKVTISVEATTSGDAVDSDQVTLACVPHEWPSHGHSFKNHRSNPMETEIDVSNAGALGVKWRFDALAYEGTNAFMAITSTPVVGGSFVYTTSWNGKLYALDRETGEVVWDYRSNATFLGIEGSPTLTADGRIILTVDKAVECLDASDGTVLWSTVVSEATESEMWGAATVANGRVFAGVASAADSPCASDGKLVALDLDSGAILWSHVTTADGVCRTDTLIECTSDEDCPRDGTCETARGAGITARPAVDPSGEKVFANTVGCLSFPSNGDSETILAFDAATGEVLWKNRVRAPEQFGECPEDGRKACREDSDCSAGTCAAKGVFHDFGFLNGPLWVDAAETGLGRPLLVSGSKDGSLYAFDPDTGDTVWRNEVAAAPRFGAWGLFNGAIAYADGRIYAGLHQLSTGPDVDHLQAFRVSDGQSVWTNPFDLTWGDASVANGVMFMGDCGNNRNCKPACREQECPTGYYFVVDADDGRIIKRFDTPGPVAGGASIVDGVVYAPYGLAARPGGVTAYAVACPGDCDLDGTTDVSELTRGVGESLGLPDIAECGIFDRNGDGKIAIDELVLAVRANLEGCASLG